MRTRILPRFERGRCVLCHEISANGLDLCQFCVADMQNRPFRCRFCAYPLPFITTTSYPVCGRCLVRPPPLAATITYCSYEYPADALVGGLKFHAQLSYGRVMGQLLASRVSLDPARLGPPIDLLLPVPLSRQRHWLRGFNQSEEIAQACAHALGLPMSPRRLLRHRHHRAQSGLPAAERRQNVRGAFSANQVVGRRIALVDDVMTTGSTLYAAATALRQAGAVAVEAWVFARAS